MADPRDLAERDPAHGAAAATAVGWQRGWAAGYAADREAETPTPGEDVYRAAARAYANALADPANNGSERGTWLEDQPTLRAAVQSAYAAGREAAAQAVLDWAAAHVAWDDGLTAQLAEIARGGR